MNNIAIAKGMLIALLTPKKIEGFVSNGGVKSGPLSIVFGMPSNLKDYSIDEILKEPEFEQFTKVLNNIKSSEQLPDELQKLIKLNNSEKTLIKLLDWHEKTSPKKIMYAKSGEEIKDGLDSLAVGLWHAIDALKNKTEEYKGLYANSSVEDILHPEIKALRDTLENIIQSEGLPNKLQNLIDKEDKKKSCEKLLNWFFENNGHIAINGGVGKEIQGDTWHKILIPLTKIAKEQTSKPEISIETNGKTDHKYFIESLNHNYAINDVLKKCKNDKEFKQAYIRKILDVIFPEIIKNQRLYNVS